MLSQSTLISYNTEANGDIFFAAGVLFFICTGKVKAKIPKIIDLRTGLNNVSIKSTVSNYETHTFPTSSTSFLYFLKLPKLAISNEANSWREAQ